MPHRYALYNFSYMLARSLLSAKTKVATFYLSIANTIVPFVMNILIYGFVNVTLVSPFDIAF